MEEVPLITPEGAVTASRPSRGSGRQSRRRTKFIVDVNDSDDEEDVELERLERSSRWRHRLVQLWPLYLFILLLEHAQFMALLLSMAQTWAWPKDFVSALKFLFWTNLDAWEYFKVSDSSIYKGVKDAVIPSESVPVNYRVIVIGWLAATGSIILLLLAFYIVIRWRWPSKIISLTAKVQVVAILAMQLLTLPFGIAMARLGQCRSSTLYFPDGRVRGSEDVLDVVNDIVCLSGKHWSLAAPTLCFVVLWFMAVPMKLCRMVSDQLVVSSSKRHEAYVRLKETEYAQSLDETWLVGQWHVFAAFKRRAVFYVPISIWVKLSLCIALALPHDRKETWRVAQASICVAVFGLALIWSMVVWRGPFRVRALSCIQLASMFVLLCNSLLGALLAANVQDPLLTEKYLLSGLIAINTTGAGIFLCVIVYLLWCWWREWHGRGQPIWPSLVQQRKTNQTDGRKAAGVDGRTARYLLALLRARQTLAKYSTFPAVLAPTHDLERHIQIINAYCREAEQEGDELHTTLWDVLDDLMAAHTESLKKSIFAGSTKESVRYLAQELYQLLPMFSYRLAQRERDFILVSHLKRRILLKLYTLSTFMQSHKLRTPQASARRRSIFQGSQKKTVTFAGKDTWLVSNSPSALDLTCTQSQVSSIADDGDEGIHERFVQQIDSYLPEYPGRSGQRRLSVSSPLFASGSATPDLFEQKLDQQFPSIDEERNMDETNV